MRRTFPLKFEPCSCDGSGYARLERPMWMRLFVPALRRWKCGTCGVEFLAAKSVVQVKLPSWTPNTTAGFMAVPKPVGDPAGAPGAPTT